MIDITTLEAQIEAESAKVLKKIRLFISRVINETK